MQINRLFEIVYLLMGKKHMTASELAEHFEVSRRTILRDLDTLSSAGIPVYTSQGKGGGIFIQDRFVLNKAVISEDEQQQILFALQGLAATRHIETEGVLGKLRSLFEKTEKEWIEVDFSRWGRRASDKEKFDVLKNAIINERAVSFIYSNSSGETAYRKVCPLKLVFKAQSWYAQAFCLTKNDFRTFKINRMRDVGILAETFDSELYSLPEIEAEDVQLPEYIDVKLLFSPQAAYRVYDEFDERDVVVNEDGSMVVAVKMPDGHWLYDYVFSLGVLVEVLEPQSVRDEIVRKAEQIKSFYDFCKS